MLRIDGHRQSYAWGSATAVPALLGAAADGEPWAEHWFGDHPAGPATSAGSGEGLDAILCRRPEHFLGAEVVSRFGATLPFLLKIIAPARALSLQVHPDKQRAEETFAAEEAAGLASDDPRRNYRDRNHKPEVLVALSEFEALVGFRAPRKAAAILAGLRTPLAQRLHDLLVGTPDARGMRAAFRTVISPGWGADRDVVAAIAEECRARVLAKRSPSSRIDRIVCSLQEQFPGDPAVVAALLLNPVTLRPGEALYVPPGAVHAYLSGTGIEVMASSDNVLRAGLTTKRVDVDELLEATEVIAAPPVRLAPERLDRRTEVFYAPVDEFELTLQSAQRARADDSAGRRTLPGAGPRIVLCLEGTIRLRSDTGEETLHPGQAVFVGAAEGCVVCEGAGVVAQVSMP